MTKDLFFFFAVANPSLTNLP